MKQFLFPTDFSESSKNAFKYAIALARKMDAQIKVVHCFAPAFDPNQPLVIEPLAENQRLVEERLKQFIQLYPNEMVDEDLLRVHRESSGMMGFPVEEIVRLTINEPIDMVIMATRTNHGLLDRLFGTVSAAVSQHAHCPVLLIPNGVSYEPLNHILYATNVEALEDALVDQLVSFASLFGSTIHFVHVEQEDTVPIAITDQLMQQLFKEKAPSLAFEFVRIQEERIVDGLLQYVDSQPINLVSIGTKHRSFWERILHKSQTKAMALKTKKPLLVIHLED